MVNSIQKICEAVDLIDQTPFGKLGKLFDGISEQAIKASKEQDALITALDGMILVCGRTGNSFEDFEEQAEVYQRETGHMRPGKDVPMTSGDDYNLEARRAKYTAWVQSKIEAGRLALSGGSSKYKRSQAVCAPKVPWKGSLSVDLRKGALAVNANGVTLIDEAGTCWAIVFPDKNGFYDHAATIAAALTRPQ